MTDARSTAERTVELDQLREWHAFENSAASAFALAKGLWQNGLYDEAYAQFARTHDLAPQAPDASIALIRAAMNLGRLDDARAAVEHALRHDPDLPLLHVHQAQLMASEDPAAARDLLAPHRDADALAHLFYSALDDVAHQREATEQAFGVTHADAMWTGHVWLSRRQPRPRMLGSSAEVLRLALAEATIDGLVLRFGTRTRLSLSLLARWSGQRCHVFDETGNLSEAPDARDAGGDIEFHPGDVADTLPAFLAGQQQPIRLLHVDSDRHDPALAVLHHARPWLREGTVIVFDDFIGHPDSEQQAYRAFHDFAREHGLRWRVLAGVLLGREVACRIDGFDE